MVKQLGEKFTEEETEEMIKLADTEGNGQIKYADFVKLMTTSYINWGIIAKYIKKKKQN